MWCVAAVAIAAAVDGDGDGNALPALNVHASVCLFVCFRRR